MSHYRNRVGQRIGSLEVIADHRRTKAGKVLWLTRDAVTGHEKVYRTDALIKLDRELDGTVPPLSDRTCP